MVTSCANMPMTRTGFLEDYSQLKPAPERTVRFVPDGIDLYVNPAPSRSEGYDAIFIEPVVYKEAEGVDYVPSERVQDDLPRYFHRKLHKQLSKDFEIVEEPRPGAIRLRTAITAIDASNVPLNIVMLILAVAVDMGGISGEIEAVDAVTGERLSAMTLCREGTPLLVFESVNRHGYARHGIKKWSKELRDILSDFSAQRLGASQ